MPDASSEIRETALALEMYQRQLDALSRQIEFLQGVLDETNRARSTLEGLGENQSTEMLMPVGASTFVRGRVEDAEHVLLGIGAGYATERTRVDARCTPP